MSKMLPKSEETQRVAFSLYPSEVQDIREHAARWGTVSRALEIAVEVLWAWEDLWDRGLLRVDPKTFVPLGDLGLGVPEEVVMSGKARPELKVPFACRVSNRTVRMIDALAKEDRYVSRYKVFKVADLWLNSHREFVTRKRRDKSAK